MTEKGKEFTKEEFDLSFAKMKNSKSLGEGGERINLIRDAN